jgi:hypothetical protein
MKLVGGFWRKIVWITRFRFWIDDQDEAGLAQQIGFKRVDIGHVESGVASGEFSGKMMTHQNAPSQPV